MDTSYNAEQREYLKENREPIGEEPVQPVPGEWAELIALALDGFGPGVPPEAPPKLP